MDIQGEINQIVDNYPENNDRVDELSKFIEIILEETSCREVNRYLIETIKYTQQLSETLCDETIYKINNFFFLKSILNDLEEYTEYFKYLINHLLDKWKQHQSINDADKEPFIIAFLVCQKWGLINDESLLTNFIFRTNIGPYVNPHKYVEKLKGDGSIQAVREFINHFIQLDRDFLNLMSISQSAVNFEEELILNTNRNLNNQNRMYIFKRFNSIYPVLSNPPEKGGGFYIRWQGKGIVVDPGFQFFTQLQNYEFSIQDIDCIFITHVHDDHCRDVSLMMSALYKANKNINGNKKDILIFGNENVFRKYNYLVDGFSKNIFILGNRSDALKVNRELRKAGISVIIETLSAYHDEQPFSNIQGGASIGLAIHLKSDSNNIIRTIIFSGDTRYDENLSTQYFQCQPQIIVLNLGKVEENFSRYYDNHLGIKGCKDIIKELSDMGWGKGVILISEFGLEMKDFRIELCRIINNWVSLDSTPYRESDIHIFPTDSGMEINLDEMTIAASNETDLPFQEIEPTIDGDKIIYKER